MEKRIIKNGFVSSECAVKVNNYNQKEPIPKDENNIEKQELIKDVTKKEHEIISAAEKKIQLMINDAKKEAERIYEEHQQLGFKKGYEEGYSHGLKKIIEDKNDILKEANNIKQDAQKKYKDLLISAEKDIVDMIMNISGKLIYDKLNNDKSAILKIIQETIEKTTHKKTITLYVSSDDFNTVSNKKEKLMFQIDGIETLEILHDETLPIGSCRVETSCGVIESNLNDSIQGIKDAFYELVESDIRS